MRGRACASDQAWLDQLTVDQHRSGDRVDITPHNGHDLHGGWSGSNYAYVDLRVRVPTKLARIDQGAVGRRQASNIASLDFDTSSGDLVADHIAGTLAVEVSSGDVRGEDIGSVDIRRYVVGRHHAARRARTDRRRALGSGDLVFDTVGSVSIGSVGSGDVSVSNAADDVTVESIGSGDVQRRRRQRRFPRRLKGSGDVEHRNVRGKVSVPNDDDWSPTTDARGDEPRARLDAQTIRWQPAPRTGGPARGCIFRYSISTVR